MKKLFQPVLILITGLMLLLPVSRVNAQTTPAEKGYFTIESYYKVKWGYADEFIALWKKNHYPLLKKLQEHGDIISIKAESPIIHSSEDSRWDLRVTIVFKTAALAFDFSITEPYKKELFKDLDAYNKEEQHRFELLISHWDVPVESVELN